MSLYGERITCGRLADEPATPPHALPGDLPVWTRDRVVDVKHSKIEIKLDVPAKRFAGNVTHTVAPLNDGTRYVDFDGVDLEIGAVTVAKKPAAFTYDGSKLRVDLGEGRKRGQDLPVAI